MFQTCLLLIQMSALLFLFQLSVGSVASFMEVVVIKSLAPCPSHNQDGSSCLKFVNVVSLLNINIAWSTFIWFKLQCHQWKRQHNLHASYLSNKSQCMKMTWNSFVLIFDQHCQQGLKTDNCKPFGFSPPHGYKLLTCHESSVRLRSLLLFVMLCLIADHWWDITPAQWETLVILKSNWFKRKNWTLSRTDGKQFFLHWTPTDSVPRCS